MATKSFRFPGRRSLRATRLALLSAVVSTGSLGAASAEGMNEAKALMERQVEGTASKAYSAETAVKFKASDNVFVKSALAVDSR